MTDLYTMGSLQPSLVRSRTRRSHGYSMEARKELVCTGDRHRCTCRRCKFYRHEHWGLRPLSSSEESSSEEEDQEKGYMSSRHYHGEYSCISPSSKRKFASSQIKQDFTRHIFSRHDDLSSYNEAGDNKCLTEGDHEQEGSQTWNKYQPLSSSVHILAGQTIPQHGVDDEQPYKSIQARCDRILDLLDPQHSRLMKGGSINPQGRNEEDGVWAGKEDTRNDVTSGMLHGGHTDRERKDSDGVDGTGPDVDFTMEVDSLGCEESDGSQDEYQEMEDIFIVEKDWVGTDQVTQGGSEFWWDNENLEAEMETQTRRHMKESFQAGNMDDSHGNEQEILLQEWYKIEELLGKDGGPLVTEDVTGQRNRETLLAEWSLIEEAIEAEKVLSQYYELCNHGCNEQGDNEIHKIITRAQREIQEIVKAAVQDINGIQKTNTRYTDLERDNIPSGYTCSTQECQLNVIMGRPSQECLLDQFSPETENIHPVTKSTKDHYEEEKICLRLVTEMEVEYDGLRVKSHDLSEATMTTAIPSTFGQDIGQQGGHSKTVEYTEDIRGERSSGNHYIFAEDAYSAGLPHRWQWHGIQQRTVDWMPDESVGDHAHQIEVAWKRRRRKFHNYMHETRENACTSGHHWYSEWFVLFESTLRRCHNIVAIV